MSDWKIALAVGALIAVSIVVGAVAYASIVAVNKPATYSNAYAPGSYGNYPSTGNTPSQYPTTPAYPTQLNAPTYPNQPPLTTLQNIATHMAATENTKQVHGAAWASRIPTKGSSVTAKPSFTAAYLF